MAKDIIAKDGFGGLYRGLSAGLLRQATYTTARLGIFNNLSIYLKNANEGKVNGPSARSYALSHPDHATLINTVFLLSLYNYFWNDPRPHVIGAHSLLL